MATRRKYKNNPTVIAGIRFASHLEAERYLELRAMASTGLIRDLRLQVPFTLEVNCLPICKYVADFVYEREDGTRVVEDAKGVQTPLYRLKKKLMQAVHGIEVKEYTRRARHGA